MKKRRIAAVLLLVLLLSGCALQPVTPTTAPPQTVPTLTEMSQTVPTQPEPETTEAPLLPEFSDPLAQSETRLFVDGTVLESVYEADGVLYLCPDDLPEVAVDTQIGEGSIHTAVLTACGRSFECATYLEALMEDHTVIGLGARPVFDGEKWYIPAAEFLDCLGYSMLEDPEQSTVYFTRFPRNTTIAVGKEIPVLMYHAVSDYCWGSYELFVSPSVLDEQIAALLENGYTPITFEDLDRLEAIEKPVMLTFDDGYDDNYDYLFPILQKYQVKATVFMIVNDIGKNHKLTESEIIEMSASGLVSVQSHTMSHNYLSYMNEELLDHEMYQSKLRLARLTGKESFVLCYPTGMYSSLSLQKTAEYYQYGLLMSKGLYTTGEDPFMIHRFYVPRGLSAEGLLEKIS